MLGFFPELHTDELLYSGVARYFTLLRPPAGAAFIRGVFGPHQTTATMDFPTGLAALTQQLPSGHRYTPQYLIANHTLLPYHGCFAHPQFLRQLRTCMEGHGAIPPRLGTMSTLFPPPERLRVCSHCVRDDLATVGEPYWRRSHQLSAVVVCPKHGELLTETPVRRKNRRTRGFFAALTPELAASALPVTAPYRDVRTGLLRIAQASERILTMPCEGTDVTALQSVMRDLLSEAGFRWSKAPSLFNMAQLVSAFAAHPLVCGILGAAANSSCTAKRLSVALNRLLYADEVAKHPMAVLLLLEVVGVTLDDLFHRLKGSELSGVESSPRVDPIPMPCANRACREFRGDPTAIIADSNTSARPFRYTCPTCGFSYMWNSQRACGRISVLGTGTAWDEALRAALTDSSCSLRAIARKLGVAPTTVQRHARRLGLWRAEWRDRPKVQLRRHERFLRLREKHRAIWLAERIAHPDGNTKQLPTNVLMAYRFLCRWDQGWLSANHPIERRRDPTRVDWSERDRHLASQLAAILSRWAHGAVSIQVRVNGAGVARALEAPYIYRHRHRLPNLWKAIESYRTAGCAGSGPRLGR